MPKNTKKVNSKQKRKKRRQKEQSFEAITNMPNLDSEVEIIFNEMSKKKYAFEGFRYRYVSDYLRNNTPEELFLDTNQPHKKSARALLKLVEGALEVRKILEQKGRIENIQTLRKNLKHEDRTARENARTQYKEASELYLSPLKNILIHKFHSARANMAIINSNFTESKSQNKRAKAALEAFHGNIKELDVSEDYYRPETLKPNGFVQSPP